MINKQSVWVVGFAVLLTALPAQARFGKKSPPSKEEAKSHHEAQPVETRNADGYNGFSSGSAQYAGGSSRRYYGPRYRYGYWSGAFIPGFGYAYAAPRSRVILTQPVEEEPQAQPEPAGVQLSAGVEGQGFRGGFTLGALISLEGERWGFAASGQNIAVRADNGTDRMDHLQVATAHLTYAFLAGPYGRLRLEGGADAAFAPNLIVIGPTGGFSGTVWIGGPFAIEGSVMVTPWPYRQFDGKIGVALGLGPVGLRAGFRTQVLDDRGLVDGVVHQDAFIGPYVGLALVF